MHQIYYPFGMRCIILSKCKYNMANCSGYLHIKFRNYVLQAKNSLLLSAKDQNYYGTFFSKLYNRLGGSQGWK